AAPPRVDADGDPLPAGALARMGTTRLRPGGGGGIFAISPDGKLLVTGEQFTLRFWDLATGKHVQVMPLPRGFTVRIIRFSANGQYLAVIGDPFSFISDSPFNDDIVYIVDVKGGKILHQLDRFKASVSFTEFLSDGKTLLTRKREGSWEVALWEVATGK